MSAKNAYQSFCQRLYSHLVTEHGQSNLFFSPLSVYSSLCLVLCGASGRTHHAIAHTLRAQTVHGQDYDATLKHLQAQLKDILAEDNLGTLKEANGIFVDNGFEVNRNFLEKLSKYFEAEMKQLSFSNPEEAVRYINCWVEGVTEDKIKELMPRDSISSDTKIVLANAIYFKGTWENMFLREHTHMAPFYTPSGEKIEVSMMKRSGLYETIDIPNIKASCIVIPFKCHFMLVVLPYERNGLSSVLKHLMNENQPGEIEKLFDRSNYNKERVDLFLPKFKFGAGAKHIDLKKPVSEMGAGSIFDPAHAEFEQITTMRKLFVTTMVHKAMIEVNEEGAEAAAATGVGISLMSLNPTFVADHPFLFFIITDSGSPIFMGHVNNPLEDN